MSKKDFFLVIAAVFAFAAVVADKVLKNEAIASVAGILCIIAITGAIICFFRKGPPPPPNNRPPFSLDPNKERDTLLGGVVLLLFCALLGCTPSASSDQRVTPTTDSLNRGVNPNLNATPDI